MEVTEDKYVFVLLPVKKDTLKETTAVTPVTKEYPTPGKAAKSNLPGLTFILSGTDEIFLLNNFAITSDTSFCSAIVLSFFDCALILLPDKITEQQKSRDTTVFLNFKCLIIVALIFLPHYLPIA